MNTIKIQGFNNEELNGQILITTYTNDRTALVMYTIEDNEQWGVMTVNIPRANLLEDEVILNTNNWSDIEDLFNKYKLGEFTGKHTQSGYCTYPIYKLDMGTIKQYEYKK